MSQTITDLLSELKVENHLFFSRFYLYIFFNLRCFYRPNCLRLVLWCKTMFAVFEGFWEPECTETQLGKQNRDHAHLI